MNTYSKPYAERLNEAKEIADSLRAQARQAEENVSRMIESDYRCESMITLLDNLYIYGVLNDKKANIIKAVRETTGLGLKEAKEIVDQVL